MKKVSYKDKEETIGTTKCIVREILDMPEELDKYTKGIIKPFSEESKKTEELEVCYHALRELTNGRYPSFFTVSHVVSGAHKEITRSKYCINPSNFKEKEFLEKFLETNIDKDGFCVSTVYNPYHLNKSISTLAHPLFIFGKNNPRFVDFVNNKYKNILHNGEIPKDIIINQDELNHENKNLLEELLNNHKEGLLMKTTKGAKPYTPLETFLFNDEQIPFIVFTMFTRFMYTLLEADSKIRKRASKIEIDLPIAYELPVFGRCDGDRITPRKTPLKWNYAEMMIDLYGLDGKKKIIFFK